MERAKAVARAGAAAAATDADCPNAARGAIVSRQRAPADLATAPFPGGALLHDPRSGKLFRLNGTAKAAWDAIRRGGDRRAIVRELVRRYDVEPAQAQSDLAAFFGALRRSGLLGIERRRTGQPPPPARSQPALDATYRIGGASIRVSCYSPRVGAGFAPLAAPALARAGGAPGVRISLYFQRGGYHLLRDGRPIGIFPTAPAARWGLVRELVSSAGGPWLALLHAAAVATPAGCLLLCGGSGAGKSTLLAGLIHAGARFMSDDIAPLQAGSRLVWPTPLAISAKRGSWRTLGRLFPQLEDAPIVRFGGRTMRYFWPQPRDVAEHVGRPVAAVLFPRHSPGSPPMLEPIDTVEALLRLGEGGSVLPASDADLAKFLAWWMALPAYRLTYDRLEEAVGLVDGLAAERLRAGGRRAR